MISLIVPTYNEAKNIPKLLPLLHSRLKKTGKKFEILIVDDDSPDGTWRIAEQYQKYNVRVIRRTVDKGLAKAVIEGFKKSRGDIIGVMDADLSHPPALISEMINKVADNDIVIASRYISSGHTEFSLFRKIVSIVATAFARPLTFVKDPMTGYFFVRRSVIQDADLRPEGYKILLEVLVKGYYDKRRVLEIPFTFKRRYLGKSKLGWKVYVNYILHLISLYAYVLFRPQNR